MQFGSLTNGYDKYTKYIYAPFFCPVGRVVFPVQAHTIFSVFYPLYRKYKKARAEYLKALEGNISDDVKINLYDFLYYCVSVAVVRTEILQQVKSQADNRVAYKDGKLKSKNFLMVLKVCQNLSDEHEKYSVVDESALDNATFRKHGREYRRAYRVYSSCCLIISILAFSSLCFAIAALMCTYEIGDMSIGLKLGIAAAASVVLTCVITFIFTFCIAICEKCMRSSNHKDFASRFYKNLSSLDGQGGFKDGDRDALSDKIKSYIKELKEAEPDTKICKELDEIDVKKCATFLCNSEKQQFVDNALESVYFKETYGVPDVMLKFANMVMGSIGGFVFTPIYLAVPAVQKCQSCRVDKKNKQQNDKEGAHLLPKDSDAKGGNSSCCRS